MGVALLLVSLFAVVLSILVILGSVPFTGVVTRYRVNYTPKGVGLGDLEANSAEDATDQQRLTNDPRVGPVVTGIYDMFLRVKRVEGFGGLYKGFMPILLMGFLQGFLGSVTGKEGHAYSIVSGGLISTTIWTITLVIIEIPQQILVNRAITTPHKLGWFSPRISLRALFTPYERRRPYVLWATPGLAFARALHIFWFLGVARFSRHLLVPSIDPRVSPFPTKFDALSIVGMVFYGVFLVLSTLVLTPLEVVSARLSVQRNHPSTGAEDVNGVGVSGLEYAGADEDVVGLRDEDLPYAGLADVFKKMIEEEGWRTLYRAWYLTLIGAVLSGMA